ncbi:MAG: hypothetical protein WC346_11885 [Methanogenium sp.]|jgi:hypothetical protein
MKRDEFEMILNEVLNDIKRLFIEKRSQYANDEEVLHNFKDVALSNNTTPEDALWGFVSKHWSSIKLMINFDKPPGHSPSIDFKSGTVKITDNRFTLAQYKDKCMDVINYMILLMAIIADRVGFKSGPLLEQKIDMPMLLKNWEEPDDTPTHE